MKRLQTSTSRLALAGAAASAAALLLGTPTALAGPANKPLPMPAVDMPASSSPQIATFAGGCFWGTQAVFQHVKGVTNVVSGYDGGAKADADYKKVSTGTTGHTETVRVTYDPREISYGKLLQVFFSVALDPTETGRQGNDIGPQYRSVLFVKDPAQEKVARAYIAQLDAAHAFAKPIATEIDTKSTFFPAEDYHQDYLMLHPTEPYIVENDLPLVGNLEKVFPQVWRPEPIRTKTAASAD